MPPSMLRTSHFDQSYSSGVYKLKTQVFGKAISETDEILQAREFEESPCRVIKTEMDQTYEAEY
jgi:hypothetical protein